ncbi:retrovirus-related pol polyprotein from transposon TNT 1-94 [Tanacetum coccineum]
MGSQTVQSSILVFLRVLRVIQLVLWIVDSGCSKHMTENLKLLKNFLVGLHKFKYDQDHLCSTCEQGKSRRAILKPKPVPSTDSRLELLHMDLCGSIDKAPDIIIKFITQIQVNPRAAIRVIRTDKGTKFKNDKLSFHYEKIGITHRTSIARTPQQNGVVERRN